MDYQTELNKDIKMRTARLQETVRCLGADACILSTSVNVFYTTGIIYAGYFYLPAEGEALHFVKRPSDVWLPNTVFIRKPEQIAEELQNRGLPLPTKVLLEADALSYNSCNRLIGALNIKETVDASPLLRKQRSVKTDLEISQVRICAERHMAVYGLIPSLYRHGMTDVALQAEIEREMLLHGSSGLFRTYGENMDVYQGSLLAGENAEEPSPFDFALGGKGVSPSLPIGACGAVIGKGQTIMVDLAGNYTPWMTDLSRVYSVGKTSDLALKAHQASIEIHNIARDTARVGTPCADLYNMAVDVTKKHGLEPYFMGTKQQAKFVGHGVGIEINEVPVLMPRSKDLLEENIVFALEPKYVIPGVGPVGIENTYLVTAGGIENLTPIEENIIEL
ncbi:Xaa-Pro aminopeptidase [Dysgonomonas sp. PH5-45]|uniref:M24 family metallopeptidase n=1 Tax=unclassified Dysgonomonas TaxID=2630389 RepID=UPI00247475E1|nr:MULTISPECIES: Xaa-Pro peptidase family protein [unclassified Dysgonomonas]MDH6354482.1 Xaa-Pro aminopeptidase [Dysgonomonas sp. PH5-45]MDH6387461.1 Xaa-Pro aminopeptidase [Dysgonomonas sp. PH5-37]